MAADFARKFGIPKSYAGYEQVLADSQVDAVYVSLPNSMHCEWTIRALQAGKQGIDRALADHREAATLQPLRHLVAVRRPLLHDGEEAEIEHTAEELAAAMSASYHASQASVH